jgi:hypothetical protein
MLWERCIGLFHPELAPVHLPLESREALLRGEGVPAEYIGVPGADPARLAGFDDLYGGWLAGLRREHATRLRRITEMQAKQNVSSAHTTLPLSTLRRALAVEALGARRVCIDGDTDGLAEVLSRCEIAERDCDAAVVMAGDPVCSHRALARAAAAVRPGGHVLARLRSPYDGPFEEMAQRAGFVLEDQIREIDYRVVPGPFVLDGAGDVLIFRRPERVELGPEPSADDALRARPYWGLDFDALAPERCTEDAVVRFLDTLAARAPRREVSRSITRAPDREIACWYDDGGRGLTAELHRTDGHIMVSLMPYDAALEYAVETTVFHVLGDSLTRLRPFKSGHYMGESIVA